MPLPHHVLSHDREPVPAWLAAFPAPGGDLRAAAVAFLDSRIAFYPGAGVVDGDLFEVFAASHSVHCILHADLMQPGSRVNDILHRQFRPCVHISHYSVVESAVWDAELTSNILGLSQRHPYDQDAGLQGACFCVLEREPHLTDQHGPKRIAFLHVQCEAVWLFWNIWVKGRRPAPFGILLQDHGLGGNWTAFGPCGALHHLAVQSGRLPKWLLSVPRSVWPHYHCNSEPTVERDFSLPPELGSGEGDRILSRWLFSRDDRAVAKGESRPEPWLEQLLGLAEEDSVMAERNSVDNPGCSSLASAYSPRRLYFAYGTNMDPQQFHQRCAGSDFVGIGVLRGYKWYITDRGVASIRPSPDGEVHGVLARLTKEDEDVLDFREGVKVKLYRREFLSVEISNGGRVDALVYVSNDEGVGSARTGYLERVLTGAQHHGLPGAAIARIQSFANSCRP